MAHPFETNQKACPLKEWIILIYALGINSRILLTSSTLLQSEKEEEGENGGSPGLLPCSLAFNSASSKHFCLIWITQVSVGSLLTPSGLWGNSNQKEGYLYSDEGQPQQPNVCGFRLHNHLTGHMPAGCADSLAGEHLRQP